MAIPILLVHWGNSDYLKYTISQAKYFNPESEIVLLDDVKKNRYPSHCSHYHIDDFSREANELDKVYVHLNTVIPHGAVLRWMKRWLILKSFVEKSNHQNSFLCIDSDVLLYSNATKEYENFKKFKLTVANECGLGNNFFKNLASIKELTDLIIQLYADPETHKCLINKYNYNIKNNMPGGVDDNHMFYEYRVRNSDFMGNTATIINGATFDSNIYIQEGFEFDEEHKIKKIYWKNDLPYGRLIATGEMVKFNTLHFQGDAKKFMHEYYRGEQMTFSKIQSHIYYNYFLPTKALIRRTFKN